MRAPWIAKTWGASAWSAMKGTAASAASGNRRFMSGPLRVALVKRELLVIERHVAAGDDDVGDRGPHFERVPPGDEQIGDLAGLEAADAIGDAQDLGGVDGQRLERLVAGEAPSHRLGSVIGKLPRVGL